MADSKLVPAYECVVRGQYQAADGKNRILKTFGPVTFVLPEYVEIPNGKKRVNKTIDGTVVQTYEPQFKKSAVTVEHVALYVVQRRLLPTWLADHHPDCFTCRTCHIVPGGLRRVMRPEVDTQVLNKSVDEMSLQELAAYCKTKGISVMVSAFSSIADAREAVHSEMQMSGASTNGSSIDSGSVTGDNAEEVPAGVVAKSGVVSSKDGVATDQEDPAQDLI